MYVDKFRCMNIFNLIPKENKQSSIAEGIDFIIDPFNVKITQ